MFGSRKLLREWLAENGKPDIGWRFDNFWILYEKLSLAQREANAPLSWQLGGKCAEQSYNIVSTMTERELDALVTSLRGKKKEDVLAVIEKLSIA